MDLSSLIVKWLSSWVKDILNFVFGGLSQMMFTTPESSFVDQTMTFFCWFTSIFAVVIVSYKIVEYMINVQNGTQDTPLGEIVLRIIKSASCTLILPWILKFMMSYIASPIAEFFIIQGFQTQGGSYDSIKKYVDSFSFFTGGSTLLVLLFILLFAIGFICFFFSICVFYADFIVLQILSPIVALSLISDQNNYFQVWWKELLSQTTSLIIKFFLMVLIVHILLNETSQLPMLMLAIGCSILLIKSPSVLKNMWYSNGSGRGVTRGAGGAIRIIARSALKK